MKINKYIIGLGLTFSFLFAGCDSFLDPEKDGKLGEDDIWNETRRAFGFMNDAYNKLPSGYNRIDNAMLAAGCDEAVHSDVTSDIKGFNNGTWDSYFLVENVWTKNYEGIRIVNRFLEKIDELKMPVKPTTSGTNEELVRTRERMKGEAHFLRAYFYFELIKRYRNIPFVLDVLAQNEANGVNPESYEKIAKFIVDECSDLAQILPVNYDNFSTKEKGRVTRAAAMALKSRVTLYMASPLFSEDSEDKWKQAAEAAYDIIKQKTDLGLDLVPYPQIFNDVNNQKAEVILYRPTGESGDFEKANFPIGVEGGKTSTCPTQNLMEAYDMKDGTPFVWNNQSNPYDNRDPRMKYTIVCNEMKWPVDPVEIWEGGTNGLPLQNATTTGYYLKKYVNNTISFEAGSTVTKKQHNWVLFRYGEILLNYAEAMINAFHDPNYKDAVYNMSAREAVNQIRGRTNISLPGFPSDITEKDFVKRLKNERRVELAFEGHRFWDVRRWKELGQTANIYGVKITKNNEVISYEKFLLETRAVTDNMYFYPIPNTERFKNPNLGQNPGW